MNIAPSNLWAPGAPYLLEDPPRSEGRVLLSQSLEEYAAIEWGFGPKDIAPFFSTPAADDKDGRYVAAMLRIACDNLQSLLLAGRLRAFARPLGGGRPVPLGSHLWEIDDPLPRFATSAINPDQPFSLEAEPTHWILVDSQDVAAIAARLCGASVDSLTHIPNVAVISEKKMSTDVQAAGDPGFLRLSEVQAMTKMSRSTIYAKVARQEFPEPVRLGQRFSRWRKAEVEGWLREPV